MASFISDLKGSLPRYLYETLEWDFLPWSFIQDRHADLTAPSVAALFDAYHQINNYLDIEHIVSQEVNEDDWGCLRCGFCCTSMRPGPVKAATYRSWEQRGAPVALFYTPRSKGRRNTLYRCWYNNDIRLKLCPFMIISRCDSKPICAIYHMGDELRPPVCSKYVPMHTECTSRQIGPEPWESN